MSDWARGCDYAVGSIEGEECVIVEEKGNVSQGTEAPESAPADQGASEDEAWEGFALDASVFRTGGGHQKD